MHKALLARLQGLSNELDALGQVRQHVDMRVVAQVHDHVPLQLPEQGRSVLVIMVFTLELRVPLDGLEAASAFSQKK